MEIIETPDPIDSVQVGKKVYFASLGFEPRTFSYPGSRATTTLLAKNYISWINLGHRLHIGLLQLQSELDNVIWGSSSPAFKGDVTQVGPDTGKQGSSGREERSERSQGSHFHLYDCLCPISLLIGGNAQRLQDSWRDSNKSNKQSKDDHVAHHCLIGLLCLLVGVHLVANESWELRISTFIYYLRGSWSSKANHDCTLLATSKLGLKNLNLNL